MVSAVNKTSLHPAGLQPQREHTEIEEELHERAHIDYDRVAIVSSHLLLADNGSSSELTMTTRLQTPQSPLSTKMP
jgi:hypothetical protein